MKPELRSSVLAVLLLFAGCRAPHEERLPAEGALGPYSAAARAGELVFVSGKIGARSESFPAEVEAAIDALEKDLGRLRLTLKDVASCTVYLTDMALYAEFNTVYAHRFESPYPARACVAVSGLPAGARVEIQAIARVRE